MASATGNTKLDLMLAVERLVGTQGVAATTVRQVTELAGQRNNSAIHYHFGSLDAAIEAVVELRKEPAESYRMSLIEKARKEAGQGALPSEAIADFLIRPLAERVLNEPGPHYFSRFAMRLWTDKRLWRHFDAANKAPSLDVTLDAFEEAFPFVPRQILLDRYRFALNLVLVSIAEIEAEHEGLGDGFDRDRALLRVSELKAVTAAVLSAPVRPESIGLLRTKSGDETPPEKVPADS